MLLWLLKIMVTVVGLKKTRMMTLSDLQKHVTISPFIYSFRHSTSTGRTDRQTDTDRQTEFSLSILTAIFQADLGQRFQNVSILDFVGAKDDGSGGDKWICKTSQIVTINKPTSSFYTCDAYHSVILATATWLAGCLSHASIVSIS